ncbi:winged helix-turn-helix domain-containing protein [Micromonospora antibiotica]|uniref:Winged helix-turn-helix transcriptional regulator n=1 Tax=Micromonospora antibiotica TaxID=2807623 RepID=A0ABS3VAM4_9ACTN|nr:winged helix-turn-helix domain-containing protein [Micromonospora antibiotica]MBO4162639.1 winged helix-turn-helix transcriptional regulator [Micromonospora antibiotica]
MLDFDPERAIWRQIADDIRRKIAAGVYAAGSRLPSETDLSQGYGVSRTTVRTVIASLKSNGLVVVEQRPGHPRSTYVRTVDRVEDVILGPGDTVAYTGIGTAVLTRATGEVETYGADEIRIVGR